MIALKLLDNGKTVRATQPKEYYVHNQLHELNGKQYWVVLSKTELIDRINKHFKQIPVTTFITNMENLFGYYRFPRKELCIQTWDTEIPAYQRIIRSAQMRTRMYKDELMAYTQHHDRFIDWCITRDEIDEWIGLN